MDVTSLILLAIRAMTELNFAKAKMFALRKDSPRKSSAALQQTMLHRKSSDIRPNSSISSSNQLGGGSRQDESVKSSSLPTKYETADGILQLQDTTYE